MNHPAASRGVSRIQNIEFSRRRRYFIPFVCPGCPFWILTPGFLTPRVDLLLQLYSAASCGQLNRSQGLKGLDADQMVRQEDVSMRQKTDRNGRSAARIQNPKINHSLSNGDEGEMCTFASEEDWSTLDSGPVGLLLPSWCEALIPCSTLREALLSNMVA